MAVVPSSGLDFEPNSTAYGNIWNSKSNNIQLQLNKLVSL